MAKNFVSTRDELLDKHGLPLFEFCIIKVYHFYGKTLRGGIGHNYMYKQVIKKEINGREVWAASHLNENKGSYFLLADKNLTLPNTEVVQY